MKWRIYVSVALFLLYLGGVSIYNAVQGPIESRAAIAQLSDSAVAYSTSRAIALGALPTLGGVAIILALALIWLPVLIRRMKSRNISGYIFLVFMGLATSGCMGPPQLEVTEEIAPNETAFLVPLEGATKAEQGKFMSIEYLETAKVATKRITIPTRKKETGRNSWQYEWIPTMKLIKVNRTPIAREWTKSPSSGTSAKDQAISVESIESIDFYTGVTVQGSIKEEDAARFLYYFSGKPLSAVMDENVRGYVQSGLWNEFGSRSLSEGKAKKREIFEATFKGAKDFFAKQGVTIDYLGGSEGLTYKDPKIQESINSAFVAENDRLVAQREQEAQIIRNATNVSKAKAEREAAEEFAKAKDAQALKIGLEIEKIRANAFKAASEKWDGRMPASILPQGSNILFGLDQPAPKK
ncbi:MAG: hypothetical protein HQK60_05975 [Deltaproteobacteria bacterium]|nr:hypothetical protein [Deltaproteobacteria bacterium]